MAKILNRALLTVGELRKVGTPVVRVLDYDKDSKVTRCSGATQPTDTDAGFAKGCIFSYSTGGTVGGTVYINEGTAASADFNAIGGGGGGAGGDTLNSAYENGRTITVDSGAITITDAQATAHTFDIDKTGTGSGDIFNIKLENAATGRVIYMDMDDGIAATGILIDSGGTARTGSDIVFTDDSTGNHSCIDINSSGTGNTIGFDFTDTETGGGGKVGAKFTWASGKGLASQAIVISRDDGITTADMIDIDDKSAGTSNIIDVHLTGAFEGNVLDFDATAEPIGNVINMDMDDAVAMTAIHIEGSGDRSQPFFEFTSDATSTGALDIFSYTVSGAYEGNVFAVYMTGAAVKAVWNIDMDAAIDAYALFLDAGNATRTEDLIEVTFDGDGNTDFMEVNHSCTGSGHIFDINVTSTTSGNVLDIVYSGASTGDAINLDMTSGLAAGALVIVGAGTRTQDLIQIDDDSAGSTHVFDINIGSTSSGNVFDVLVEAVAFTGDVLAINLGATATASSAIILTGGDVGRTVPLVIVNESSTNSGGIMFDLNRIGITAAVTFDIDDTAACSGNVFDYAAASTSTGTIFEVNMSNAVGAKLANFTVAGIRTADAITITHTASGAVDICAIVDSGTSSGHIFDINSTGNSTGNVIDIVASGTKVAGHILHIDLGTDLAGNALLIDAAGIRTAPIIFIENDATDAGVDDHVIYIKQVGQLDSNAIQIEFATAASTGNGLEVDMGSVNVVGMAINVVTQATGTANEGAALDIKHTVGALAANADVVRIISDSDLDATSNVVSIIQQIGAGTAGAYGLHIKCTGTNVEGLYVENGDVAIDEALTVTGTSTLGAVVYSSLNDGTTSLAATALELNRVCDTSGRLIAAGATLTITLALHDGKTIKLDTAAGSICTLPAATGTGAIFRFLVTAIATSNSHIIKVVGSDVMDGTVFSLSDGSANVIGWIAGAADDTITLNRSTTGSVTNGEYIELVDSAIGVWSVHGFTASNGTEATPFSSAV